VQGLDHADAQPLDLESAARTLRAATMDNHMRLLASTKPTKRQVGAVGPEGKPVASGHAWCARKG
jgi:hypothetical protein